MINGNDWDFADAKTYRKRGTVFGFHQRGGATYDKKKEWGSNQEFPGAHWTIVGIIQDDPEVAGQRLVGCEIYGCSVEEFAAMYAPAARPNEFRKAATIQAIQMPGPFTVQTVTADGNEEVKEARGEAGDWLGLQPGGERQRITAAVFAETYERTE